MSTFSDSLQESRSLLKSGKFEAAFTRINKEKARRPDQLFIQLSIMSDAGIALGNPEILHYCTTLLKERAQDVLAVQAYVPYHWFNLANLYTNLLVLQETAGKPRPWFDRSHTALAREAYRRAADSTNGDSILKSAVNCAHAYLLVGLGREKEAFGLFHQATILDVKNQDAEMGRIELLASLSGTAPYLENILLKEAGGKLLRRDWESSISNDRLEEVYSCIQTRIGTGTLDLKEPDYPHNTVETYTEQEYQVIMLTLKNQLYLSPCSMCRRCDRAIGDTEVLGAKHAMLGTEKADSYSHSARIIGRLSERHRALRKALIDYIRGENDSSHVESRSHLPDLEGWKPASLTATSLINVLSGSHVMLEGMTACIALHFGITNEGLLGTPEKPGRLKNFANPAIHGFWDLWADGMEGVKIPIVRNLYKSMSSDTMEFLLSNSNALTEAALAWTSWLGLLISQLVRMVDRDARGDTETPPIWPLQPFRLPSDF